MRRGLWQAGMVMSLTVHGLVYGIGRSVVLPVPVAARAVEADFLGAILSPEDLHAGERPPSLDAGSPPDVSCVFRGRASTLDRLVTPAFKPIVLIARPERSGLDPDGTGSDRTGAYLPTEITSDLSRASAHLEGLEVRDLFRMIERQGVRGEVVLDIAYSAGGRVERVVKVFGSGNPLLDDSLIVRVKDSVVAKTRGRAGRVRIRLRLR